jgi:hypothetical protein
MRSPLTHYRKRLRMSSIASSSIASRKQRARRVLIFVLLAAGTSTAAAQPAQSFTPLFDGTLEQATIENGGTFRIDAGVLRAEGPEGWLRFPPRVRDFRMRVELRFLTDDADSGVFFRALPDGAFGRGWPNRSYQVQLLNPLADSPLPPIGGLFRHGMPPGETALDREAVSAAFTGTGEWQLLEIEVLGAELTVALNGAPVTRATGIADVAGYIGIQSETSAVEFRRIDIAVVDTRR